MNNPRFIVLCPGLPHILQKTQCNKGYRELAEACTVVGEKIATADVGRIIYFSTSWISVLGQMVQCAARVQGEHVDENWYEFGSLPFDIKVDTKFAQALVKNLRASGKKVHAVDYPGFPVDTGSIVVDKLINPHGLPTVMMANHVYSDNAATKNIARVVLDTLSADSIPTAVVAISLLSTRHFTTPIDLREDAMSDAADDPWHQRLLQMLKDGKHSVAESILPEYAKAVRADWGFKVLPFMNGLVRDEKFKRATVHAYAPIYGAQAAVVEY